LKLSEDRDSLNMALFYSFRAKVGSGVWVQGKTFSYLPSLEARIGMAAFTTSFGKGNSDWLVKDYEPDWLLVVEPEIFYRLAFSCDAQSISIFGGAQTTCRCLNH